MIIITKSTATTARITFLGIATFDLEGKSVDFFYFIIYYDNERERESQGTVTKFCLLGTPPFPAIPPHLEKLDETSNPIYHSFQNVHDKCDDIVPGRIQLNDIPSPGDALTHD